MAEALCPVCNKKYQTVLERKHTHRLIQNEFPDAPSWQREQLISGVCSDACWNKMFPPEPDDA